MKYKGIIFNSATVLSLQGGLAEAVREHRIRTAVVSTHGRTEVAEVLSAAGITVDVVVGGFDLSRWGEYRKPAPDMMFVAAARMDLDPEEVVAVTDCDRDVRAARGAGMGIVQAGEGLAAELIPLLGVNPPSETPRDFRHVKAPVTGLMGLVVMPHTKQNLEN